ncbi:MAG: hypothetical protein V3V41_05220 [Candidatus Heimdallarchaeota archaeon]
MKLKVSLAFIFTILLLVVTAVNVQGKESWDIWADQFSFNNVDFTVSRDNMFVKMRVTVYEGGPVSVFVLDESSYNIFSSPGNTQVVEAFIGAKNLSSGTPATVKGSLGLERSNTTGEMIFYYIVVDNRANAFGSNVEVEMITTVPAPSVFLSLLTLVPIAVIVHKRRRK